MFSSALSQYKDVVHSMPNTYLQVDSLFDIDKCIRICFEKIWLRIFKSQINIARNKKAMSFL